MQLRELLWSEELFRFRDQLRERGLAFVGGLDKGVVEEVLGKVSGRKDGNS